MLTIRPEQREAFESVEAPYFEDQAMALLKESLPKHATLLGEQGLRETVRYGVKRAALYGLTRQSGVNLFIDLTLRLGRFFDGDPQLPWAGAILADPEIQDQEVRAGRLYAAAATYLDRVSGPNGEFIQAAIQRLQGESLLELPATARFEDAAAAKLKRVWPQKFDYLGEAAVGRLIEHGKAVSDRYAIAAPSGRLLILGLMYMLGSGFDADPLAGWAGEVLRDKKIQDQASRLAALYRQARSYLKEW